MTSRHYEVCKYFILSSHQRIPDMEKANLSDALKIPKAVLKRYGVTGGLYMALKGDVPTGSGLGLSGAVTVSIVQAVATFRGQSHDKAELGRIASEIEIGALSRPIGMQDQYAAAYGGLNFMTFSKDGVDVAPVTLPDGVLSGLERRLLLFHTGASRDSASILAGQKKSTEAQVVEDAVRRPARLVRTTLSMPYFSFAQSLRPRGRFPQ